MNYLLVKSLYKKYEKNKKWHFKIEETNKISKIAIKCRENRKNIFGVDVEAKKQNIFCGKYRENRKNIMESLWRCFLFCLFLFFLFVFLLSDRVLASVAFWAVLALPSLLVCNRRLLYFSRDHWVKITFAKKRAFRVLVPCAQRKKARGNRLFSVLLGPIFCQTKRRKFGHFAW